jgi:WhiB family redox-sensing transcriptional regulator
MTNRAPIDATATARTTGDRHNKDRHDEEPDYGDWHTAAACRGLDTDRFYNPDNARGRSKHSREAAAKAVCADCPVVANCLRWALSMREPYGVWGGRTAEERDDMLAGRFAAAAS